MARQSEGEGFEVVDSKPKKRLSRIAIAAIVAACLMGLVAAGPVVLLGGFWVFKAAAPAAEEGTLENPIFLSNPGLFKDDPEMYAGKVLSMWCHVASDTLRGKESLQDLRGFVVPFTVSGSGSTVEVMVGIPEDIDVPKAATYDKIAVLFVCSQGSVSKGNLALRITRN